MEHGHRSSTLKRGLSFTFTILLWVTIPPAVVGGIVLTAVFAYYYLDSDVGRIMPVVAFGFFAMLLLAIPGHLVLNWQFRQRILRPLRNLGTVMVEAGKGDLTVRGEALHDDEIRLLVDECNGLIGSLGTMTDGIRRSAESVSAAAVQLSAASQEISSSAVEISASVQQIADGAELQSRKVDETTDSIDSIHFTTNEVLGQAKEAATTSEEAARVASDGEETTTQAIMKIAEVQQAIETLAGSVELLGKRSDQIGSIVDVITTIADQTNLLSLNAAIEAARAGESGRGFSVVAEEVRKLAEGSGRAAEQIGALIKEVQQETAKAVHYMEIGTREVEQGSEVVGRTGESLRQITDAVSRTAVLAEQISHAMAVQVERTSGVDKAMHEIVAVVEQNAASAEETAAAAEEQTACMEEVSSSAQELSDMAESLEDSVRSFRTDEGTHGGRTR